jgi:hypothetical protein
MTEANAGERLSISRLIMMPALITLAVSILRLVGELEHWSTVLFNPTPGGGAAIVGITWLAFIFGVYFALKLAGAGQGPASSGKAIGFAVLGFLLVFVGVFLAFGPKPAFPGKMVVGLLVMAVGGAVPFRAWPALAKTLAAYGYAARIPVAVIMFFAMRGNWGTHYDVLPPGYTGPTSFWGEYFAIALVPQLVFWVAFTITTGSLFGSVASAVAHRGKAAAHATS